MWNLFREGTRKPVASQVSLEAVMSFAQFHGRRISCQTVDQISIDTLRCVFVARRIVH